ncbi:Hypothetical predicted protein, partial [Paramuricea clavata]
MAGFKIVALIASVTAQIGAFTALLLQLYGLILLWKIHEKQKKNTMLIALQNRRSYFLRKLKVLRQRRLRRRNRSCWFKPGRSDQWWIKMINGEAPDEFWMKNFRMTKESFLELETELKPYISPDPSSPNHRALDSAKKLAVTLYYLKDTGSLIMTANAFGIAVCTVSGVVVEVSNVISKVLGPKYLHLPVDENEMRKKVCEFETKFGIVQAFGCIDGTHVPILRPLKDPQDYFCYKMFYSLNVQAVCDYRGIFMDVECRWPGSVHDAKVFANSSINQKLVSGQIPMIQLSVFPGSEKIPNYVIGDPAYPLTPFCMKEYATCASNEEVIFNTLLRAARNPIECAFGRLKARWSVLTKKVDLKIESIPVVVYACCVLHNYCEINKSYVDEDLLKCQMDLYKKNEDQNRHLVDPVYSGDRSEGGVVRKTITNYIRDNLPDHL